MIATRVVRQAVGYSNRRSAYFFFPLRNTITVSGSLEVGQPEGAKTVWQEFGPSQFRRQIGLPAEVNAEQIQAAYRNGILLLTVPKAEHAKPRQIKVQQTN